MITVHGQIGQHHYQTRLHTATHQLIADEPLSAGGTDTGFSPSELLASALATCTCVTLRMYADRKGWPLDDVQVEITFERDSQENISYLNRFIGLVGDLSVDQRERLLQIANGCFIHRTLTNPIHIRTQLSEPTNYKPVEPQDEQ